MANNSLIIGQKLVDKMVSVIRDVETTGDVTAEEFYNMSFIEGTLM